MSSGASGGSGVGPPRLAKNYPGNKSDVGWKHGIEVEGEKKN